MPTPLRLSLVLCLLLNNIGKIPKLQGLYFMSVGGTHGLADGDGAGGEGSGHQGGRGRPHRGPQPLPQVEKLIFLFNFSM